MFKILMITCCLFYAVSVLALDIVKGGKAVLEIVLAKDANQSQKLGAADLQEFFEKISGAKVEIVPTPSGKFKNKIYVGESDFTKKLGFDLKAVMNGGYRLLVDDDYAIVAGRERLRKVTNLKSSRDPKSLEEWREFAGEDFDVPRILIASNEGQALGICKNDDTGTWYASSELLEQLGVRFYHPYENGTIVPQSKDLVLEKQDLVRIPRALDREYFSYNIRNCPDFFKWMKRNRYGLSIVTYANHTIPRILSKDLVKKYPQILARNKDGKPLGNHRQAPLPNLTDPKFRELSIQFLRAVFDYRPEITAMSLGMPDGMGSIDYEDSLKYRVAEKDRYSRFSDYVWDYWSWAAKELKKTHPDKYLICHSYGGYSTPPSDPKLVPDNVFLSYCYWTAHLLEEYKAKPILDRREQWFRILGKHKTRMRDYLFYGRRPRPPVPMFFFELLQRDTQAIDGWSFGRFTEGESADKVTKRLRFTGLMHFTIYWQGRLFWDANADREQIMNEYFRLYFGPAEKEMKEFYEFSEYHFAHPNPDHKLNAKLLREHNEKYFEILARARRKAGKDTVYDKRIAEIETEMQPLKKQHESLLREGPDIRIKRIAGKTTLDGRFDQYGAKRYLRDHKTGEEIAVNATAVAMAIAEDKSMFYVIVECHESKMDEIKADIRKHDDGNIFNDDVVEVYVETPEAKFFKVVVNANGAIYDETTDPKIIERDTLPILWESEAEIFVEKTADRWIVELAIPTRDFGTLGPTQEFPWGFQIGRTRFSRGRVTTQSLCPTGGRFDVTTKWANIWSK